MKLFIFLMNSYIYIRDNEWYRKENVVKIGISTSIKERNNTYITGEIYKGNFIKIIKIDDIINLKIIDNLIKLKFKKYNVYYDGGTEFYKRDIINKIEIYLSSLNIKYQIINYNELKRKNIKNKYKNFIKKINNNLRDYQIKIINEGYELLKNNKKLYLELATGAGKSLIAYNLINLIKPKNIIILSPRIEISKQNISDKYLKYLNYNYNLFISKCIQSITHIYKKIIENNLEDIFIWFDEAHYGINKWINNLNEIKNFFLYDKSKISYRLFTSASPNKEIIIKNEYIFGKLYSPIKVSKLIENDWLSDIKIHIFKEDYNIDYLNLMDIINNSFINLNINIGICFNNNCDIAFSRFNIHLNLYLNNKTNIKPYLLLNNIFISKIKLNNKYTDINIFNKEVNNSLGYLVDKYSVGYDNKNINFLIFLDPKYSNENIIQSIGRGLRPDGLGINGTNLKKINNILLPVYINDNIKNNYENIIAILKYLIIDIELDISLKNINYIYNNNYNSTISKIKYNDTINIFKDIEIIVYNIYKNNYKWNIDKITRQLKLNMINNYKEYKEYIKEKYYLNLPLELFRIFPHFNFYNTYDNCPYYNKKEIIEFINKNKQDIIIFDDDYEEIIAYLNKIDNKFPNICLWYFYGGFKEEYFP